MRRSELRALLFANPSHACTVDRRPVEGGYERLVTLERGNRVVIELNVFDNDEGGLRFVADFETLEEAIAATEKFLGSPFATWPTGMESASAVVEHDRFKAALTSGSIALPDPSVFRLHGGDYWREFLPFPSRY
jgi:hypothetical protein